MIYKILLGVVGLAGLVPHGVFGGLLPQTPPQTIEDGSEPSAFRVVELEDNGAGLGVVPDQLAEAGARELGSTIVRRPLFDFISQQGTTHFFVPPFPDLLGFSDAYVDQGFQVDYTGIFSKYLDKHYGVPNAFSATGYVLQKDLSSGHRKVSVCIQASSAMMFVVRLNDSNPGFNNQAEFGRILADIAAGAPPQYGNATFRIKFVYQPFPSQPDRLPDIPVAAFHLPANPNGPPQPSYFSALSLSVLARAQGPLHQVQLPLGGGFPPETPGRLQVLQLSNEDPFSTDYTVSMVQLWEHEPVIEQPDLKEIDFVFRKGTAPDRIGTSWNCDPSTDTI